MCIIVIVTRPLSSHPEPVPPFTALGLQQSHPSDSDAGCISTQHPSSLQPSFRFHQWSSLNSAITKVIYSGENSADIGLQFPLYTYINRSSHILWLLVKFEKSFWKHFCIDRAFSVFILLRKHRYLPLMKSGARKMPLPLFPLPYNVVSHQFRIFLCIDYISTHILSVRCVF